jgi:hypothetical protein
VHNTIKRLEEQGYTIKSEWKMVPPKKTAAKK